MIDIGFASWVLKIRKIYQKKKLRSHSDMRRKDYSTMAIACIAIFLLVFLVFQFHLSSISRINATYSTINSQDRKRLVPKSVHNMKILTPPPQQSTRAEEISCDRAHYTYDICSINGPTVLDPIASTLFLKDPTSSTLQKPRVETVRPYTRKSENFTMSRIKEVTLVAGPRSPKCNIQHKAPALVFSAGGYTGNFFHEFNDGFIPLYITVNSIFPNQDVVLVISKARDWWINKYKELLQTFSKYPIINLDNDTTTHCFPFASVGMISHGFMTIDPAFIQNSKKFTNFRAFLGKAYDQNHKVQNLPKSRPLLVLVGRSGGVGRLLLNQNEVRLEAENVGFDVTLFEPTPRNPLKEAYALINSSHAMVGIHGAALTHSLFLRPGSVFVQVVPLGAEWVAKVCFERSARAMGLEYMEYRIKAEESSLIDKYSEDDMIVKDPVAFRGKNWSHKAMTIYLKEQNVKLDMVRFREYLKEAYTKAKKLMDREG
ncbi:xylan glycosyltransferase MUCI21-like isoform X2 [Alnus glutinosa]|uniref:xylan glycosyltransferase MUCI21-like isoform X2 n=1 Tax=Alnus glutinosa TaxID=3517 RepID=UPI002D79AAF0|nr:xylan glycosyltransferase MUCI21-like isoform X2 [Alnus glutinosa]